jgi:hypothetical protein
MPDEGYRIPKERLECGFFALLHSGGDGLAGGAGAVCRHLKGRNATMAVWGVRAGRHGESESYAVDNNVVVIGWDDMHDLSGYDSREEIGKLMAGTYPDVKPTTLPVWTGEVWAFKDRIKESDLVVLPLKTRSALAEERFLAPTNLNLRLHRVRNIKGR